MSDSDFEEIGFSDCESQNVEDDDDKNSKTVMVELPLEMINDKQAKIGVPNAQDQASVASSFIPINRMSGMKLQSKGELKKDDDVSSTWSHVSKRSTTERDCDESSTGRDSASLSTWATRETTATSSTEITGFDLLSLNGSTHRKCKRCSFLNSESCITCQTCYGALVANPCLDIDVQICLNLQRKESDEALQRIRCQERKRKQKYEQLESAVSYVLATRIAHGVDVLKRPGVKFLPKSDLGMRALRFIRSFRGRETGSSDNIQFGYHFSDMTGSWGFREIQKHGLREDVAVSPNIEAALKCFMNNPMMRPSTLFSISEDSSDDQDNSRKLCWIVATVDVFHEAWTEEKVTISGGNALVTKYKISDHCLPLVCFDSSLRNNSDLVSSLMNSLSNICRDFFSSLGDPSFEEALSEQIADIEDVCAYPPPSSKQQRNDVDETFHPAEGTESHVPLDFADFMLDMLKCDPIDSQDAPSNKPDAEKSDEPTSASAIEPKLSKYFTTKHAASVNLSVPAPITDLPRSSTTAQGNADSTFPNQSAPPQQPLPSPRIKLPKQESIPSAMPARDAADMDPPTSIASSLSSVQQDSPISSFGHQSSAPFIQNFAQARHQLMLLEQKQRELNRQRDQFFISIREHATEQTPWTGFEDCPASKIDHNLNSDATSPAIPASSPHNDYGADENTSEKETGNAGSQGDRNEHQRVQWWVCRVCNQKAYLSAIETLKHEDTCIETSYGSKASNGKSEDSSQRDGKIHS